MSPSEFDCEVARAGAEIRNALKGVPDAKAERLRAAVDAFVVVMGHGFEVARYLGYQDGCLATRAVETNTVS